MKISSLAVRVRQFLKQGTSHFARGLSIFQGHLLEISMVAQSVAALAGLYVAYQSMVVSNQALKVSNRALENDSHYRIIGLSPRLIQYQSATDFSLICSNKGLGPAIVTRVIFEMADVENGQTTIHKFDSDDGGLAGTFVREQGVRITNRLSEHLNFENKYHEGNWSAPFAYLSLPEIGTVIPAGSDFQIFWLDKDDLLAAREALRKVGPYSFLNAANRMMQRLGKVSLTIEFTDADGNPRGKSLKTPIEDQ